MKHYRFVLSIVLSIGLSFTSYAQSIWNGTTVATSFQSGTGTASDPYLIYTPEQLAYFLKEISSGRQFSLDYVKIMADINLGGHDVHGNGTFDGYLDGNNHWISGYDCEEGYNTVSTHAGGCLFNNVSGVIHNLAIAGRTSGSYNIFSYAGMAITKTLSSTGHIYNCVYNIWCSNYASGSVGTMACTNYGRIENCYSYGTFSTVFDGTDARSFGAICYENMKTGVIRNCKYDINKASYGGMFAETAQNSAYNTDRKNAGLIETYIGDEWVLSHTDYEYSTWSGQYGLACFDPNKVSTCTITFFDELKLSSVQSYTVTKGNTIGELPRPTSNKTFMGWYRNNTLVMPTDIVASDWTLFAKWQNCIHRQPTSDNPSFDVDDASKASFQWYEKHDNMLYDNWDSGVTSDGSTSKKALTLSVTAGMNLTFDWRVSSEVDYDYMYVQVNGQTVLKQSGSVSGDFTYKFQNDGEYIITFAYTKDGSDGRGLDKAWFTNISVGYPDTKLTDACSSTLPQKYTALNGDYYCKATYSDGSNELCSDIVSITVLPCETPSIVYADKKLYFKCATENANIHWAISAPAIQLQGTGANPGNTINETLENATITITAYATAPGFGRSETITRKFGLDNLYDVNGDGKVNIADITSMINAVLSKNDK